jgi:hypothetical protein
LQLDVKGCEGLSLGPPLNVAARDLCAKLGPFEGRVPLDHVGARPCVQRRRMSRSAPSSR